MLRRFFFLALLFGMAALTGKASDERLPNVVVLLADDMSFGGASCYGARWGMTTPALDRLAAEGVRCTDAYVTSPTCGPSRAGLVTGRMQTRFGAEFNGPRAEGVGLPLTETTIGSRMQALGYTTGIVGKWHLGGDAEVGAEFHPLRRGFDEFFGFHGSMVPYFRSNALYRDAVPTPVRDPAYLTDMLAREAAAFIERHAQRPFFVYVAFNAVHTPYQATPEDLEAARELPPPPLEAARLAGLDNDERARVLETIAVRRAMLRALDRAVSRIMAQLEDSGVGDDTLVIFTNDNGDWTHNHPYRGGKGVVLEGGVRVPFILRWPEHLPAGDTFGEIVSTLDILPTAVAAAGGEIDPAWQLDGVNLLPYLTGQLQGAPHEALFWRLGQNKGARIGDWKLYYSGFGFYSEKHGMAPPDPTPNWHLYHLVGDPAEQFDLKAHFPEKFAELRAIFDAWEAEQAEPRWPFGPSGQMGQWQADGG